MKNTHSDFCAIHKTNAGYRKEYRVGLEYHLSPLHVAKMRPGCHRCLLNPKAAPIMKIIQDIFSLILKFRSQLVIESWQRDPDSGALCHPGFKTMLATYKSFNDYSRFLFKGIDTLVRRLWAFAKRNERGLCITSTIFFIVNLHVTFCAVQYSHRIHSSHCVYPEANCHMDNWPLGPRAPRSKGPPNSNCNFFLDMFFRNDDTCSNNTATSFDISFA